MSWYHRSRVPLPLGTILVPQGPGGTVENFEGIYERQPERRGWIFLSDDPDLWDFAGAYVYRVEPLGKVERFSLDFEGGNDSWFGGQYVTDSARVVEIVEQPYNVLVAGRDNGRWFHASAAEMPVGTILIPGGPDGRGNYEELYSGPGQAFRRDYVWVAPNTLDALNWGQDIRQGETDFYIYEVEPIGEVLHISEIVDWASDFPMEMADWGVPQARITSVISKPMNLASKRLAYAEQLELPLEWPCSACGRELLEDDIVVHPGYGIPEWAGGEHPIILCDTCFAEEYRDPPLMNPPPVGPFYHASALGHLPPGFALKPQWDEERFRELMKETEPGYDWDDDEVLRATMDNTYVDDWQQDYNDSWVFFTNDLGGATQYNLYRGTGGLYEVEPLGEIYWDPNSVYDGYEQFIASECRVVREL